MTKKNTLLTSLTLIASLALVTTHANATLYTYEKNDPTGSHAAGKVTQVKTSYSNDLDLFTWSHTIEDTTQGQQSEGFWLVVSDGPNPKTHAGELAILYGDAHSNTVTAYEYSGQNNGDSWNTPGNYLGSWALNTSRNTADNHSIFSFALNSTAMNSVYTGHCSDATNNCDKNGTEWNSTMWDGAQFGDELGYWFHPFIGSEFTYDSEGNITGFDFETQGWYDKDGLQTVAVSEPATLPILALALSAGLFFRRKKQSV